MKLSLSTSVLPSAAPPIRASASTPSNPNAPHAAQRLVDEMETLRSAGNLNVWPTTRAWNSVISAWSQWKGEEMVSSFF